MHVNDLAKQVGVEAHVVRFYTQTGLLDPCRDPKNRYREYSDSDISRLRFIRRARWLGFTLKDIRAILGDADRGVSPRSEVREIIKTRLQKNRRHIRNLEHLQASIEQAVSLWESMSDRPPDNESLCDFIDAVAQDDGSLT